LHAFIDPRLQPAPSADRPPARTTTRADELAELRKLCIDGQLYEVERWIQTGRPLQVDETLTKGRARSALEETLEAGNYALTLLLLSNGYDPNRELNCPLDLALRSRRFDLVDLLLVWGADPRRVNVDDLFDTYSSSLFERFRELGVDLTDGHALAEALAFHTSNKPLLGFAKRHRTADRRVQTELDIALAHHAAEGNEKGVQLSLWAGANPHVPVLSLRFPTSSSDDADSLDNDDAFVGFSAIYEACQGGHAEIFSRLGPDPAQDDFEELWRVASSPAVIDLLARNGLPANVGAVIRHHLWWATFSEGWRWVETLRRIFEAGVRWQSSNPDEVGTLRRSLLKVSDRTFVDLMKLLATADYCSSDILKELARTPSMRDRMKKVGFIPSSVRGDRLDQFRPTGSREVLKRFGVEIAQRPQAKSRSAPTSSGTVRVGRRAPSGEEIRLSRQQLFEQVWSKPVATLAEEWGLSGPGLKKVCRRLVVPVPPRGYWAKLNAGKSVRRAKLPVLPGETSPSQSEVD
jgi:hypothetical protein